MATTDSGLAARVAAIASIGAAVIHFAVMPDHWRDWVPSGVFFAGIAVFQLVWGLAVLTRRPGAVLLATGILANLGSVALWALSRTAGAPFGPHAGEPELVQAAGICSLMLQGYVVMGAAWLWSRGRRSGAISVFGYGLVLLGATSVIAVAAAVGVASGLQHQHHSGTEAAHGGHAPATAEGHAQHDHSTPAVPPQPAPGAPAQLADTGKRPPPRVVVVEPAAPAPAESDGHDHDHDHG